MAELRRRGAGTAAALAAATLCAAGCAVGGGGPAAPDAGFDPVGSYDLVLSWEGGVQEGRMVVRREAGGYRGTLSAGSLSAIIGNAQAAGGRLTVSATTAADGGNGRPFILRLVADGDMLSGEWFFGAMRGGVHASKRPAGDGARTGHAVRLSRL